MAITKVDDRLVYSEPRDLQQFLLTGAISDSEFSIVDENDKLKQMKFSVTELPTDTVVTVKAPETSGKMAIDWVKVGTAAAPVEVASVNALVTLPDYQRSYLYLGSDGISLSPTPTLSNPTKDMQEVKIHIRTQYSVILMDAANLKLRGGTWTGSNNSVITLIGDTTSNVWTEQSRNELESAIQPDGGGGDG